MTDDLQRLVDVDMKPGAAKRVMTIWREAMKDFKNLMTTDEKCLDKSPFTCEGRNAISIGIITVIYIQMSASSIQQFQNT